MKRISLSLIAAGLMLGGISQLNAMDAGLTFGVQIIAALTSHLRGRQAKALQETFVTALRELEQGCKKKLRDGSSIVVKPYLTNAEKLQATMKVTYVTARDSQEQELAEFPLQKPDPFETVKNYKNIIGTELFRTTQSAALMINQRIKEGANPVTGEPVESPRKESPIPSITNTISHLPTQYDEQQALRSMFDTQTLSIDPVLVPVKTDADGLLFAITTNRIHSKPVWRVFHLPDGLEVIGHRYNGRKKIIEEPVIAPRARESNDEYLKRCENAQADLIARATSMVLQKANGIV